MHKIGYQFNIVASSGLIMVFGLAITVLSIFLLYDQTNILEIVGSSLYRDGIYIAAFSGILIILICFISYLGACFLNRFFIIMTCVFQIIIAIMLLLAGILILSFDYDMSAKSLKFMENSLVSSYNKTSLITNSWDEAQIRLRCCAVSDRGWQLYRSSYWSANTNIVRNYNFNLTEFSPFYQMVPESCCYRLIDGQTGWPSNTPLDINQCQSFLFGPPRYLDGAHNPAIYYRGCFNATRSFIRHYSGYMGGLCIITVPIMILGIVVSFQFLLSNISEKDD